MPDAISRSAVGLDLSPRVIQSTTVVASPAAAAETIICQTPALSGALSIGQGVLLFGWAAYTVGTNGTAVQLRVRQTNVAGTLVVATGALTGSQHGAAILSEDDVQGFDTGPASGQVYVLTMQVTAGSAPSTVSACQLVAIAI